jgi:hypothetical protein
MKKFVTRKRSGFLAILLAILFAFTGIMPMVTNAEGAENWDIDKPVIGELTMTHNGETVSPDTNLDVSLKAEDLGSGIRTIHIEFALQTTNGNYSQSYDRGMPGLSFGDQYYGSDQELTYDEGSGLFKGTASLKSVPDSGMLYISKVEVTDKSGNVSRLDGLSYSTGSQLAYKYFVNLKRTDDTDTNSVTAVTPVVRDKQGQYTDAPDRTFEPSNSGYNFMKIEFATPFPADVDHLAVTYKIANELRQFDTRFTGDDRKVVYDSNAVSMWYSGITKCNVIRIYAIYKDGSSRQVSLGNVDTSYKIHDDRSTNFGKFSLTITKDGKEITTDNILTDGRVKKGDVLTFKAKLDGEDVKADEIDKNNTVLYLRMNYSPDRASDSRFVSLTFDQPTQTFTGSLTVDERMYPTEWVCNYLNLIVNGHSRMFYPLNNKGFIVSQGSTTVIPQVTPTMCVEEYNKDSSEYTSRYVNLGKVNSYSRLTEEQIKKLNLPDSPESPVEGAKFEGWYITSNNQYPYQTTMGDEASLSDFCFTSDNTYLYIYPKFDKNTIPFSGYYIDQDGVGQSVNGVFPESVHDQKSVEDYLNQHYPINENETWYFNSFAPWGVNFRTETKDGINKFTVYASYYSKYEYTSTVFNSYFKDELSEDMFNAALKRAKETVKNDVLGSDQVVDWKIVDSDITDYDSFMKARKNNPNYNSVTYCPEYKDDQRVFTINLRVPYKEGGSLFYDYPVLAKQDATIADLPHCPDYIKEDVSKSLNESLKLLDSSFPYDKDTKLSDILEDDDIYADAVTDKPYVTLSVYDNDKADSDNQFLYDKTLIANDNNEIILPDKIDGYKYVSYEGVGKKAEHGGTYKFKKFGTWIDAYVSNAKQPEVENADDPVEEPDTPDPTPSRGNSGKQETTVPENGSSTKTVTTPQTNQGVNTATNATQEERALVAVKADKLMLVEATKDKDGGVKATPAVVQEQVKAVADAVAKAANSKTKKSEVKIEMDGANIVPVEVLKEAKGKNIDVTFDMGGYSWTVNGKNIGGIDLKDINLAVDMNTNAIPSNVVTALAGSNNVQQISLRHEGNFGFKATLTMKAPTNEAGKYGNLYWYDSDHKLVFIDSGLVKADGTMQLDFSHASDYVIVYGKNMAKTSSKTSAKASPKTGDQNNGNDLYFMIMMLTLAAASAFFGMRELRKAKRERF